MVRHGSPKRRSMTSGDVVGIVGILLALAGMSDLPLTFRVCVVVASGLCFLSFAFKAAWGRTTKVLCILAIVFISFAIVRWLLEANQKHLPIQAGGEAATRQIQAGDESKIPHLSASLIFDSGANTSNPSARLIVENSGSVSVFGIKKYFRTSQGFDSEPTSTNPTVLAPSQKVELHLAPFQGPSKIFDCEVVYDTLSEGRTTEHYARFSFALPIGNEDIKQPLLPEVIREGAGDDGVGQRVVKEGLDRFAKPVGTISISFPSRQPDGSPNQMAWRSGSRLFAVNSASGKAALWEYVGQRPKIVEVSLSNAPNHIIIFEWNDATGDLALAVDGGPLTRATSK